MKEGRTLIREDIRKLLDEILKGLEQQFANQGKLEEAAEISKARRLINRGAWKVRRANPYARFLSECLRENKEGDGLKGAQEAMRKCAIKWRNMSEEEKRKYMSDETWLYEYD